MIKGIGIDIIEIDRIRESLDKHGDRFLNRVYTPHEINYCTRRKEFRIPELAARFAAKEAYTKALGTGMHGIHWKQIEVRNDPKGKPYIESEFNGKDNVQLSLSHSQNYAVAYVVIEENR
jgi:holo-[acyl-carrier-protein] synthase